MLIGLAKISFGFRDFQMLHSGLETTAVVMEDMLAPNTSRTFTDWICKDVVIELHVFNLCRGFGASIYTTYFT